MMMSRTVAATCVLLVCSLTHTSCISQSVHSDNQEEDVNLDSYNPVFSDLHPAFHRRQRSSYLSSPSTSTKRAPDDGGWMRDYSRQELSSFRDIKYRYMGLGKRRFDPMNFNIGLGKRADSSDMASSDLRRPPVLIPSRDVAPFAFVYGEKFPGSGSEERGASQDIEERSAQRRIQTRAARLQTIRKRLGRTSPGRFDPLVTERMSKRRFDPKINFLGLGK